MKKLFTLFIAISFVTLGFSQIWTEDFESNTVGDGLYYYSVEVPPASGNFITGITSNVTSPPWDVEFGFVSVKPAFTFSVQDVASNNVFQIDNVERTAPEGNTKWVSEAIDVSGTQFNCSVDVTWAGNTYDASDYIKIEFYIDGDEAQTINKTGSYLNAADSPETFTSENFVTGSSLVIVISSVNNTSDIITFDNVAANEFVPVNNTIYEIQYTTTPGPNGTYPSLLVGQEVTIEAAVTAISNGFGYYLQEADGNDNGNGAADWRGVYVNDNSLNATIAVGDIVKLTGTVFEVSGKTTISAVTSSTITLDPKIFYNPDIIIGPLEEKNESVLSVIRYFRIVDANESGDDIRFTAGIGESPIAGNFAYTIEVDKSLYEIDLTPANQSRLYEVLIGATNYNGGVFRLAPRDGSDINFTSYVPVAAETVKIDANRISAISNNIVLESENISQASIYNLAGQMVKTINVQAGRTEIEMNAGVYVVKMNTGNDVITEKVLVK